MIVDKSTTLHHVPGANTIPDQRSLRTEMVLATENEDDGSEERGIADIAKLAESGTKKLTDSALKLTESTKIRLTSNNQRATDKLFTKLMAIKTESEVLESPAFLKWVRSITKSYSKNPEAGDLAMVSTLQTRYDDEALANLILAAKGTASLRATAGMLGEAQLKTWMNDGKTVGNVFNSLKLGKEADNLFETPLWGTWASYAAKMHEKNADEVMFSTLKAHYGDEVLANILAESKKRYYGTKIIAEKLEEVKFNIWASAGKSADDIFNLLKLKNQEGDELWTSSALNSWISYTAKLDENPYQLLLVKLMKRYDDATLAKTFVAAKRSYATEFVGTKLEEVQLKTWLSDGKTADDVFKLLQLNKEGGKFFESPEWSVWVSYLTKLDDENADELMFMVLIKALR